MVNPMMEKLGSNSSNGMLRSLMSGNPNALFSEMMQNNPQFRDFVNKNKGKSPEQIAREYGIDPRKLMR